MLFRENKTANRERKPRKGQAYLSHIQRNNNSKYLTDGRVVKKNSPTLHVSVNIKSFLVFFCLSCRLCGDKETGKQSKSHTAKVSRIMKELALGKFQMTEKQ